MAWVAVLVAVSGFAVGLFTVRRFVPALAPTREGTLAFRLIQVLVGAAASVAVVLIYTALREFTHGAVGFDSSNEQTVLSTFTSVLIDSGTLLGFAGAVYLLAPPAESAVADRTAPHDRRLDA